MLASYTHITVIDNDSDVQRFELINMNTIHFKTSRQVKMIRTLIFIKNVSKARKYIFV